MERLVNKQIFGVIDATIHSDSFELLTQNRPVASLPFAGRYRLIDFMLSNMVHAGIDSVGIFSHHTHNSLQGHIGSGKVWDLDRKNGGLFFYVQNEHEADNAQLILHHNKAFFSRAPYPYVVIAPSNIVGRVPILNMLRQHKEQGSIVTQVVHSGKVLPIYLLTREHLVDLIAGMDKGNPKSLLAFIETSLADIEKTPYEVNEYLLTVDSLQCYYDNTLDLLNQDKWHAVFQKQFPVLTKTKDEPPAKYYPHSKVTNSIIANGCIIEGTITNSVVARGVKVGAGAIIRDCIIMPGVVVGKDCILDGAIIDKDVTIAEGIAVKKREVKLAVVPKGEFVFKEWE
ncbi:MAG: sugar phosphate nucleotidyltransferase [Turicibacter sp.]|nr:sugar phosphate nucleotidyltransferase [Turicibacter sp.]